MKRNHGELRKLLTIALGIAAMSAPVDVSAQFNKGGRTAFQFVKIGVGARQVAVGEACISFVTDINGVFWNPATLTGISNTEASFSYASWFADLQYLAGAVGYRIPDYGVLAVQYASLDYGTMPEALITSPTGSADTRTGNSIGGGDVMVGLTFSREFTDQLSIGFTAKYLKETLFQYGADLFAFDVGTFYDLRFKGIRLAMSAQNFAGSVKYLDRSDREEGYDIPLIFRMGTSVDVIRNGDSFIDLGENHLLTISADALHTNDFAERLHIGGEYWFSGILALRGGYRFNYDEGNMSFGLGLHHVVSGVEISLDYAYVSFEYLESPHRVTMSMRF